MDSVVLLLNADYEPLNVCDLRRAFRLVFGEKAEVIEYDHTEVRTPLRYVTVMGGCCGTDDHRVDTIARPAAALSNFAGDFQIRVRRARTPFP